MTSTAFADAAPTSHLKVFLPPRARTSRCCRSRRRTAPSTPTRPPPVVRTYTPRALRPGDQDAGDPVPPARDGPGVRVGAAGQAGRQARRRRPGGRFSLEPVADALVARRRRVRDPRGRHPARRAAGDRDGRRAHRGRGPGRRDRARRPGEDHDRLAPPARTTRSARNWRRPPARRSSPTAPGSG